MGQYEILDPKRLVGATVPLGVSWQLGTVIESRGRQDLYEKQVAPHSVARELIIRSKASLFLLDALGWASIQ
ncbi:MAG: hypothetical protein ACE5JQ_05440 [Candidatus Methylomirabilales bacterium]